MGGANPENAIRNNFSEMDTRSGSSPCVLELRAMPPLEFLLYCSATGAFILKTVGAETSCQFSTLLDALTFIERARGGSEAILTVYDQVGRAVLKKLALSRSGNFWANPAANN
jgi:hypothetical protein